MTPKRWQSVASIVGQAAGLQGPDRERFLQQQPAELREDVDRLLQNTGSARDFLETPLVTPRQPVGVGARIGPYVLTEELGRGGMSVVFRGERSEGDLGRAAAIKILGFERLTASRTERVQSEAAILAHLQHPNIATLYDAGVTDGGFAYLIMELVDGEPLARYCDSHHLTLRQRLQLFQLICSAVQYAHQHLIVHRDLKPGNILVTKEGVPKLLDFGIAKVLDADSPPSPATSLLSAMTPDYASPEQIDRGAVTTGTDVYSLGLILYELLAGTPAFRTPGHTLSELLEARRQQPERPSKLRQGLPEELDSVVFRALAFEPVQRYTSARDLAADIGNYLEGRPVAARPDTFLYRARKFAGRRAIPLAAAGAVIAVAMAGVFSTLAQSRRAERRFSEVRTLAHSLLFDVYDSISGLPGSLPARRMLASRAQQYLDRLERESAGDSALTRELAESYVRLGGVLGSPYSANLGDTSGALGSFRKAAALLERESARYPEAAGVQEKLAEVHTSLGRVLIRRGNMQEAISVLRQGCAEAEALYARHRDFSNAQNLSLAYNNLAEAHALVGDQERSLAASQEGLSTSRKALEVLEAFGPRSEESWQVSLASRHFRVGYALYGMGSRTGEVSYYRQALDMQLKGDAVMRALAASNPERPHLRELADDLLNIGLTRWKCCRDLAGAMRDNHEALQSFRRLADDDPNNLEARRDVANAHMTTGEVLGEAGRRREALEMYRIAVAVYEELAKTDPASAENAKFLAQVRARITALERGH